MSKNKNDELSIFISLILRHKPEVVGIKVDKYGYVNVVELIGCINKHGKHTIDIERLDNIVKEDINNRYSYNDDKTKIMANQGHSFPIDLGLLPTKPPKYLYHGTASRFVESIMKEGIKKGSRTHVHLSTTIEKALTVGNRHGESVLLTVDAEKMYNDGYDFFISKNKVWLTDFVPKEYICNK